MTGGIARLDCSSLCLIHVRPYLWNTHAMLSAGTSESHSPGSALSLWCFVVDTSSLCESECENGGTCTEVGECSCMQGFEGKFCRLGTSHSCVKAWMTYTSMAPWFPKCLAWIVSPRQCYCMVPLPELWCTPRMDLREVLSVHGMALSSYQAYILVAYVRWVHSACDV